MTAQLRVSKRLFVPVLPRAACRDESIDPEIFYPKNDNDQKGETKEYRRQAAGAKEICHECPERDPCLAYALRVRERYGIWGGKSPEERRRILRGSTTRGEGTAA
jgi:WhiB family redox-sensing transcriptional regulator